MNLLKKFLYKQGSMKIVAYQKFGFDKGMYVKNNMGDC